MNTCYKWWIEENWRAIPKWWQYQNNLPEHTDQADKLLDMYRTILESRYQRLIIAYKQHQQYWHIHTLPMSLAAYRLGNSIPNI